MKKYDRETLINYLLKAGIILGGSISILLISAYLLPLAGRFLTGLFFMTSPFILAWLVAILTQPIVDFLNHKLRIPRGLSVIIMLLFFLGIVSGVMTLIIGRVIIELSVLSAKFPSFKLFIEKSFVSLQEFLSRLNLEADDLAIIKEWLVSRSEQIMPFISSAAGGAINILQATPTVLVFLVVTVVATFFWCRDMQMVENTLVSFTPQKYKIKVVDTYRSLSHIIYGFCRAQILLIAASTIVCIIAYMILRVDGPVTIGLITGFFDILPIFGPGTIIIPWCLYSLIVGNYYLGFGLLILYIFLIVFRNILQPKLVGDRIGLHPLATLASIFIGLGLFGIWGLFIGPVLLALIFAIWKSFKTNSVV